jgi:hypothetical protein
MACKLYETQIFMYTKSILDAYKKICLEMKIEETITN